MGERERWRLALQGQSCRLMLNQHERLSFVRRAYRVSVYASTLSPIRSHIKSCAGGVSTRSSPVRSATRTRHSAASRASPGAGARSPVSVKLVYAHVNRAYGWRGRAREEVRERESESQNQKTQGLERIDFFVIKERKEYNPSFIVQSVHAVGVSQSRRRGYSTIPTRTTALLLIRRRRRRRRRRITRRRRGRCLARRRGRGSRRRSRWLLLLLLLLLGSLRVGGILRVSGVVPVEGAWSCISFSVLLLGAHSDDVQPDLRSGFGSNDKKSASKEEERTECSKPD